MTILDPKVSILIPAYNVERFICQCLDSILSQSYRNLEICIVNDGSTDDTDKICQEYASNDARIRYKSKENAGVADARNRLLQMATGDFTLFVDADDWIELDMVSSLIEMAQRNNADVVCCGMVFNDERVTRRDKETIFAKNEILKKFLFHNELKGSLWNKLVKTSLFHNLSFPSNIHYGEDAFMCWQFFQKCNRVVITERQFYHYRLNESSISHLAFGKKKISGHYMWQSLCKEVKENYPQFLNIAYGRWGIEDVYLLIAASMSGYAKDNDINEIQKTIRTKFKYIRRLKLLGAKHLIFAYLIARWYGFGRIYIKMHTLR